MAFACNGRRKLASRGREHRTPKRTKNGGKCRRNLDVTIGQKRPKMIQKLFLVH